MLARSLALLLCLTALASAPAIAIEVKGLYAAAVPVEGKDEPARRAALGRALEEVLVKVSGSRSPDASPAVAEARARPERYVQAFEYLTERAEPEVAGAAPGPRLMLSVRFDPAAVNQLLRGAGQPVWSRARPSLLAWIAIESGGGRTLAGAGDAGPVAGVLADVAGRRGLAVDLPLLDLEDRGAVRVADVWGGFNDGIVRASRRYRSDAVLTGRIYRVLPTLWEGRWTLITGDTTAAWTARADVAEAVVEEGVDGAADRLAAQFAEAGNVLESRDLALLVTGVDSLEGYARTLAYLGSLDLVTKVRVVRVEPGRVTFDVDARGGMDALAKVVALGRTLAPEGTQDGRRYRLLP